MTDLELHPARWFHREGSRFRCDLCPRRCLLSPGQRAFCFVRVATDDGIALSTWGRSSGFCVDPIEKKPLDHFYPGSAVLSFGTAGCNLGCKFCQNFELSTARDVDRLAERATPERIAEVAKDLGCQSVAFTYNDPIVFAEYALDVAAACRALGIRTVAVTNGYVTAEARGEFFAGMDAANIDLKAFDEDFYTKVCLGHIEPVKEAIEHAVSAGVWVELTTLLIPHLNDDDAGIDALSRWIAGRLGPDVPLHFTAFHPDHEVLDRPPTPLATLRRARSIAMANGLRYVYTGNASDRDGQSTRCPQCRAIVVGRDGYRITEFALRDGACAACGTTIAGRFAERPGTWGARRLPVHVA